MKLKTRTSRSERGAVAVEFALVAPILLALVMGIVEFSNVYNAQVSVTQAAREGARTMAIENNQGLAQTAAKAGAPGNAASGFNVSGANPTPFVFSATSAPPEQQSSSRSRIRARTNRPVWKQLQSHRQRGNAMRRLTRTRKDPGSTSEKGAAGVTVALMMLVLIGAGALAVDTGQIYAERAQFKMLPTRRLWQ